MANVIEAPYKTLPTFARTASSIWEYTPPTTYVPTYSPSNAEPSLIILCTWTGAQNRYIADYTAIYQKLFPLTRIMVIATTTMDLCFRTSQQKQDRLKPAIQHISKDDDILLHVFSEGGSNKACELAEAYYKITHRRLPVSALCFDSTPGSPSLASLPLFQASSLYFRSAMLGAIQTTYAVSKGFEKSILTRTRKGVLDTTYLDDTTPRCYLYSKEDAWEDVHEHAKESIRKGVLVKEIMFQEIEHVRHALQDPNRYWDAIITTWRSAIFLNGRG